MERDGIGRPSTRSGRRRPHGPWYGSFGRCGAVRCGPPDRSGWCLPTLRRPVSPGIIGPSLDPMTPAHGTRCQTVSGTRACIPSAHPNEVRRPANRARPLGAEEAAAARPPGNMGRRDTAGVGRERSQPRPPFEGTLRWVSGPTCAGSPFRRRPRAARSGRPVTTGERAGRGSTADAPGRRRNRPESGCRSLLGSRVPHGSAPADAHPGDRPAWQRCASVGRGRSRPPRDSGPCGPSTHLPHLP